MLISQKKMVECILHLQSWKKDIKSAERPKVTEKPAVKYCNKFCQKFKRLFNLYYLLNRYHQEKCLYEINIIIWYTSDKPEANYHIDRGDSYISWSRAHFNVINRPLIVLDCTLQTGTKPFYEGAQGNSIFEKIKMNTVIYGNAKK